MSGTKRMIEELDAREQVCASCGHPAWDCQGRCTTATEAAITGSAMDHKAPIEIGLLYEPGSLFPFKLCDALDGRPLGNTRELAIEEHVDQDGCIIVKAEFYVLPDDTWPKD